MYVQSSLLTFMKCMKTKKRNASSDLCYTQKGGAISNANLWFLIPVFGTLIFQLTLTFVIMKYFSSKINMTEMSRSYWTIFLCQLGIIAILVLVPMHPFLKFFLFTIFSVLTGLSLSQVAHQLSNKIINSALVGTIGIFIYFVVVGVILASFGIDLGWTSSILVFALLAIIIARLVEIYMKDFETFHRVLTVLTLMLFSMFIVYDTNKILQRDYHGDFVTAAIDYFLDIINIFLNVLNFSKTS
jgi:FtsH-binding integral membrane protein